MKKNHPLRSQSGIAMITLLVFTIMAISITAAAVAITISNIQGTLQFQEGTTTHTASESGIENALMTLLRNPDYTGETMQIEDISVVVTVSGTDPKTITSIATSGQAKRTIEVIALYTDNMLTVSSWKETQ